MDSHLKVNLALFLFHLKFLFINVQFTASNPSLISQLRKMLLRLKGEFMAEDGSGVNYALMSKSEAFQTYKSLALDLQNINLEALKANEEERKAFFINLYNILMIHGLIAQGSLPEAPTKVEVRLDLSTFLKKYLFSLCFHVKKEQK